MQHSQSDISLGTKAGSWADIKEGMKKRSNTAQNLQYYGELFLPIFVFFLSFFLSLKL
jgi:hypothetical protein